MSELCSESFTAFQCCCALVKLFQKLRAVDCSVRCVGVSVVAVEEAFEADLEADDGVAERMLDGGASDRIRTVTRLLQ